MKVVNMNKVLKEVFINPIFTGREVTRQVLLPESKEYEVSIINFGKGVRNKYHAHEYEQILIITEGKGIVATEKGEKVVTVSKLRSCRRAGISPFRHPYIPRCDDWTYHKNRMNHRYIVHWEL
jgi:hypothetical protein